MSEIQVSAVCVVAASVLLAGFMLIADRHGPGAPGHAGVLAEFTCINPRCGRSFRRPRAEGDIGHADRYLCPACGEEMLVPMARCVSCGARIPRPRLVEMPAARCPRCGGFVYGR